MAVIHVGDDGDLNQVGDNKSVQKWMDWGYILEVDPKGFLMDLMRFRERGNKDNTLVFDLDHCTSDSAI